MAKGERILDYANTAGRLRQAGRTTEPLPIARPQSEAPMSLIQIIVGFVLVPCGIILAILAFIFFMLGTPAVLSGT